MQFENILHVHKLGCFADALCSGHSQYYCREIERGTWSGFESIWFLDEKTETLSCAYTKEIGSILEVLDGPLHDLQSLSLIVPQSIVSIFPELKYTTIPQIIFAYIGFLNLLCECSLDSSRSFQEIEHSVLFTSTETGCAASTSSLCIQKESRNTSTFLVTCKTSGSAREFTVSEVPCMEDPYDLKYRVVEMNPITLLFWTPLVKALYILDLISGTMTVLSLRHIRGMISDAKMLKVQRAEKDECDLVLWIIQGSETCTYRFLEDSFRSPK